MVKLSRLIVWLSGAILLLAFPVSAQDGYPLPENLPVITPENASQLTELASLGGDVPTGLAWSPDGQTLAVGTSGGVLVYDVTDFTQPRLTLPTGGVSEFNAAGQLVSTDGTIWDIQTGLEVSPSLTVIASPSGQINVTVTPLSVELTNAAGAVISLSITDGHTFDGLTFSPDESRVILKTEYEAFGIAHDLSLWDVETGALVSDLPTSLEFVREAYFFPARDWIIVEAVTYAPYGGIYNELLAWDLQTLTPIPLGGNGLLPAEMSSDGKFLAHYNGSTINLYSANSQMMLEIEWFIPYGNELMADVDLLFTSDDQNLIVKTPNQIDIWQLFPNANLEDHPAIKRFSVADEAGISAFSITGDRLAVYSKNPSVSVWDIATGEQLLMFQTPDGGMIRQMSADFSSVATHSDDGTLSVWRVSDAFLQINLPTGSRLNADLTYAAQWDVITSTVLITEVESGEPTLLTPIAGNLGDIKAINANVGVVVFQLGNQLHFYDINSGEQRSHTEITGYASINFTPDGTKFILEVRPKPYHSTNDIILPEIRLTSSPSTIEVTLESRDTGRRLFSPDRRFLSFVGGNCDMGGGQLTVKEAAMGETVLVDPYECGPNVQTYSADGRFLAVGGDVMRLYDVTNIGVGGDTSPILAEVYFGGLTIDSIDFSGDGETLAVTAWTYGEEGIPRYTTFIYRLSDVLADGETVQPFLTLPNVFLPKLSPDGMWLFSYTGVWNVASGELVREDIRTDWSIANGNPFNPDGTLAVIRGEVIALNERLDTLTTLEKIENAVFSPDGTRLYMVERGRVRVFGIAQ